LTRLLQILGITLVLGGLAHSAGVIHLYTTQGVPDANRIMLDVWIAEAQLLSGGLYLAASRAHRARAGWRGLAAFGALTMIGFAAPILPVLVARAPFIFRVPAVVYLVLSLIILSAAGSGRRS
jgi:hypothetical protein